jgi:hypothetical protein
MASRAHNPGGSTGLPLALIAQAIPKLTRHDLEALTERLIDYLDAQDGDLDTELNGDEMDGTGAEDDHGHGCNNGVYSHPGCPIADPDTACDDHGCDEDSDRELDDHPAILRYGMDQSEPLPIDHSADRTLLKRHRDFIRSTRCDRRGPYALTPYKLRH